MEAKDITPGKLVSLKGKGAYKVIGFIGKSKVNLVIQDIELGEGWCNKTKKLIGVDYYKGEKWIGWSRGENYTCGYKYNVHIKALTVFKKIKSLPRNEKSNSFIINYD